MAIFYNQASLSYGGNTINSNIVSGEVVEVLTASKNATLTTYFSGDEVTYVVSAVNSGTTAITGLTLTDDLGAYDYGTLTLVPLTYVDGSVLYYANGVLQATPTVSSSPSLVITGLTVPAGGNAVIIYKASINSFAPLGEAATITNTATISGTELSVPITASSVITAGAAPDLSITKAITPETVTENSALTYTFTILNYGSAEATAADLVVTDTFNPILSDLTVTYNGSPWTEGVNYTYDETTGEFATIAGEVSVPAATYSQDTMTGVWAVNPGTAIIRVTGTI